MEQLIRTKALLGERFDVLQHSSVMIIGVGGVGSHAAEALARMGVGRLYLVDFDVLAISNSNRHIQSTEARIGMNKAEAMKQHMLSVLPLIDVQVLPVRFSDETKDLIFSYPIDVVIDAIDIMTNKLQLIQTCLERSIPFISSMGMANRIDPLAVTQTGIYQTSGDRFASIIRAHARKHGWPNFPVVTSTEPSSKTVIDQDQISRHVPASCYLVPAAGGLNLASWVCRYLVKNRSTC